jgi:hypothetical protein
LHVALDERKKGGIKGRARPAPTATTPPAASATGTRRS